MNDEGTVSRRWIAPPTRPLTISHDLEINTGKACDCPYPPGGCGNHLTWTPSRIELIGKSIWRLHLQCNTFCLKTNVSQAERSSPSGLDEWEDFAQKRAQGIGRLSYTTLPAEARPRRSASWHMISEVLVEMRSSSFNHDGIYWKGGGFETVGYGFKIEFWWRWKIKSKAVAKFPVSH